ncbi:MAG: adenosylmethionine--8-amino-7-oxononanoate transaminase [Acidobacteria bacterium]|nr:adenosylmethionine--8-amino-7-oxononanoate transaminase [Acidobacteriota bacterium]|tara:strand:+ start:7795 stop:9162 length:1368 start_codon:yes stop_codon:yes gene_type:complete
MTTPSYEELKTWDHMHVWHPFTQMQEWLSEDPIMIARGEGNYLIDIHGNRYLDGVSSLWCNVHGHTHKDLNSHISDQLDRIAHSTMLGLANIPATTLAKKLVDLASDNLTRIFYSDAGSTATEIALKLSYQYWQLKNSPQKVKFVSLVGGYHGDTLGAVGVGYSELFHHYYQPLLPDTFRLSPPHIFRFYQGMTEGDAVFAATNEAQVLLSQHHREIAALIIEPLMQGAAGMWTHPISYLQALRDLTKQHDILLICDEVATGFGRTGKMFACSHADVQPDVMCVGKGLTGGYLPLAVTFTSEEIFSAFLAPHHEFKTFFHGHTYTGNPLACAAALANLEIFEEDQVLGQIAPRIAQLKERLQTDFTGLVHVADVRQCGLMVGIELMRNTKPKTSYKPEDRIGLKVATEARKEGVMIRPLGDVIVLMPPLSISSDEMTLLLDVTHHSIQKVTCQAS